MVLADPGRGDCDLNSHACGGRSGELSVGRSVGRSVDRGPVVGRAWAGNGQAVGVINGVRARPLPRPAACCYLSRRAVSQSARRSARAL